MQLFIGITFRQHNIVSMKEMRKRSQLFRFLFGIAIVVIVFRLGQMASDSHHHHHNEDKVQQLQQQQLWAIRLPTIHPDVAAATSHGTTVTKALEYILSSLGSNHSHSQYGYAFPRFIPVEEMDITLVTQGSVDKLPRLVNVLERWQGPISCAILISTIENIHTLLSFMETYSIIQQRVTIHLYFEIGNLQYPINIMRNLALFNIESNYFFALDIDFLPNANAYEVVKGELPKRATSLHKKTLWVLPAFERFQSKENKPARDVTSMTLIPRDKAELVLAVQAKVVAPFHEYYPAGHIHVTNYTKWYHYSTFSYSVPYKSPYEPYVIGHRLSIPPYWPGFRGFGLNKASWFLELDAAGYTFEVLGQHFVVHMNHRGRQGRTDKSGQTQIEKKLLMEHLKTHYGVSQKYLMSSGIKW